VAADIARYTFLTEGIEAALAQARAAAGAKDVLVVGGANVARQYLEVSSRAIGHLTLKPTRGVSMGFVTAW
jgi:dihydrofolate reductase